jgi:hypothetical protein
MLALTAGWLALLLPLGLAPDTSSDKGELVTLSGRVVLLTNALKASGHAFDAEPIAKQVVVQGADGTLTPILSDDASRALFLDEGLRDRPAEIKGRRYPGNPYVQVLTFRIEDKGRLRTPEYYCEICTISVRYPQICPCCQGPMELRMRPEPR